VEVFHSKLSRKKKLSLDAQMLTEAQSIKSDFQYSFKIEKHYFNVIQTDDSFELRIDNRSFSTLMAEDRSGKSKSTGSSKVEENVKAPKKKSRYLNP
jgi:hypothetical protein